jgi:hypothetical protein
MLTTKYKNIKTIIADDTKKEQFPKLLDMLC